MTAELSARLRKLYGQCLSQQDEYCLEVADALDANARELAHHIRLNADLRLSNADLQGHANILAARIAELERAAEAMKQRCIRFVMNTFDLAETAQDMIDAMQKITVESAAKQALSTLDTKAREG